MATNGGHGSNSGNNTNCMPNISKSAGAQHNQHHYRHRQKSLTRFQALGSHLNSHKKREAASEGSVVLALPAFPTVPKAITHPQELGLQQASPGKEIQEIGQKHNEAIKDQAAVPPPPLTQSALLNYDPKVMKCASDWFDNYGHAIRSNLCMEQLNPQATSPCQGACGKEIQGMEQHHKVALENKEALSVVPLPEPAFYNHDPRVMKHAFDWSEDQGYAVRSNLHMKQLNPLVGCLQTHQTEEHHPQLIDFMNILKHEEDVDSSTTKKITSAELRVLGQVEKASKEPINDEDVILTPDEIDLSLNLHMKQLNPLVGCLQTPQTEEHHPQLIDFMNILKHEEDVDSSTAKKITSAELRVLGQVEKASKEPITDEDVILTPDEIDLSLKL